jgi:hypothetical protein
MPIGELDHQIVLLIVDRAVGSTRDAARNEREKVRRAGKVGIVRHVHDVGAPSDVAEEFRLFDALNRAREIICGVVVVYFGSGLSIHPDSNESHMLCVFGVQSAFAAIHGDLGDGRLLGRLNVLVRLRQCGRGKA